MHKGYLSLEEWLQFYIFLERNNQVYEICAIQGKVQGSAAH